jgi:diaminopimelate epimerase
MTATAISELLSLPFTKMSGSGNDFIVIDNRDLVLPADLAAPFTRLVSRRRLSIGADGVVLIEPSSRDDVDFTWRYINADGSDGEMCGNGAMCGARFAALRGIAPAECAFLTPSGIVRAVTSGKDDDPSVRIAIAQPGRVRHGIEATIAGIPMIFSAILVGVPHAVAIVGNADRFPEGADFTVFGRETRHHAAFAPAGTNVNIITVRDRSTIRMRTYERGVEDETLACGTGAIASAVVAASLGLVDPPVHIIVSSGRRLVARFDLTGAQASNVLLEGQAHVISDGVVGPDALVE